MRAPNARLWEPTVSGGGRVLVCMILWELRRSASSGRGSTQYTPHVCGGVCVFPPVRRPTSFLAHPFVLDAVHQCGRRTRTTRSGFCPEGGLWRLHHGQMPGDARVGERHVGSTKAPSASGDGGFGAGSRPDVPFGPAAMIIRPIAS